MPIVRDRFHYSFLWDKITLIGDEDIDLRGERENDIIDQDKRQQEAYDNKERARIDKKIASKKLLSSPSQKVNKKVSDYDLQSRGTSRPSRFAASRVSSRSPFEVSDSLTNVSFLTRVKKLKQSFLSQFSGSDESPLSERQLYKEADKISEGVASFFDDEEARKQKFGIKKVKFKRFNTKKLDFAARSESNRSASMMQARDDGGLQKLSLDSISVDKSLQYKKRKGSIQVPLVDRNVIDLRNQRQQS